jgi:hypothetical protein
MKDWSLEGLNHWVHNIKACKRLLLLFIIKLTNNENLPDLFNMLFNWWRIIRASDFWSIWKQQHLHSLRQIDRQTKSSDFTSDWRNRLGNKQHLFSHTFLVLVRSKHKSISLSFVAKPLQVEPQICNEHPGKINSINRQQPHTTADRPGKLFYNYLEMLMRK